jgi:two-component system, NarL family, nitrate/nitrite response regulator NarL
MDPELQVLIVAEGDELAAALLTRLPHRFGVGVLGPVPSEVEAVEAVTVARIDLVIVGLGRSDGREWDIISALADRAKVLTVASDDAGDAAHALACGAVGVIRGDTRSSRELAAALRRAAAGALVLPDIELSAVMDRLREAKRGRDVVPDLTSRELEVLRAMATGASSAEVARSLSISPLTVRTHLKNIMSKLGVHSKVEVATFALRMGLSGDRRSA